jgi:type II secretory pathway pseudopilin PulG
MKLLIIIIIIIIITIIISNWPKSTSAARQSQTLLSDVLDHRTDAQELRLQ